MNKKSSLRAHIAREFPFFLSVPAVIWQVLFFYIPAILIISMSFVAITGHPKTIIATLSYYLHFMDVRYLWIIGRSLLLALVTSVLCLFLAYPVCYYLVMRVDRWKNVILFFLILPFWTSMMVQVYSWFFVLDRYGLINRILLSLHIISQPLQLLNGPWAVYCVMLYCYFPFMLMPLYASLEKLDRRLLEASADLGATSWQTFVRITIPLTLSGIQTGFFLVFVPSFGELVIPVLLGGGKQAYVGPIISQYFLSAQEPHLGAAFTCVSGVLLIASVVVLSWLFGRWLAYQGRTE